MPRPRLLGVLLCYNDGDFLSDAIEHLLEQNHDVVVWNHGSTDETAEVLERTRHHLREVTDISREVEFYDIYPLMSKHLMTRYVNEYDWISWPDQDEILEGPTRARPYRDCLEEAVESSHAWIEFHDFVFWFTDRDDPSVVSPCERIRHYSLARHGAPKIRSWRASATNVRWFNHNKTDGSRYPVLFNLRHYPMRSAAQMQRRLSVDRAGLQRGPVNSHYENMKAVLPTINVKAEDLHVDDGRGELNPAMKFDWTHIYGSGPKLPRDVMESFLLSTKRWEIAATIQRSLLRLPSSTVSLFGTERIERWLRALDRAVSCPIVVTLTRNNANVVTEDLAHDWSANPSAPAETTAPRRQVHARVGSIPVVVSADSHERRVHIAAEAAASRAQLPLVALVPRYGTDELPRLAVLERGAAAFDGLKGAYYYLTWEPDWAEAPAAVATASGIA